MSPGDADQRQQRLDLVAVDAARQQWHVGLDIAAQHVQHGKAAEIAVFQVVQRLAEDDAVDRAVAVDQREAAIGLARQHMADQPHHRRDAAARGDGEIGAAIAAVIRRNEAAGRRHDLERRSRRQILHARGRRTARRRRA